MVNALKAAFVAPSILVTTSDYERIHGLIDQNPDIECSLLEEELDRAQLVAPEQMSAGVITMNSKFLYWDSHRETAENQSELVYANTTSTGKISILSPLGASIIGLKEGDEFAFKTPNNQERTIKIIKVIYQPEQDKRFDL